MTSAVPNAISVPSHLLLATDLSARCDRALDRAAQLARQWQADLTAVHVLESSGTPAQLLVWAAGEDDVALMRMAQRELSRDLSGLDVRASMRVVRGGDPASTIRNVAAQTDSGLVVVGMARGELLGRFVLGSSVEALARSLSQPLLIVRNRVHDPYRRILVATDFSDSSRRALQVAACFFPGSELIVYHAMTAPGDLQWALSRLDHQAQPPGFAEFMAAAEIPSGMKPHLVSERGRLEEVLARYVRDREVDLVIAGSHGSSGIMSILLGSSVSKLLCWLPCDTMVVREPAAA
jgi:nucleotide-binding universal stress UspA family protein